MKSLLMTVREEILRLRRRNEVLEAKTSVIDVFAAALFADTSRREGVAIDVVWQIDLKIAEMDAAQPTIKLGESR